MLKLIDFFTHTPHDCHPQRYHNGVSGRVTVWGNGVVSGESLAAIFKLLGGV